MNKDKAIQLLERLQDPEPYEPMLTKDAYDAIQMAIDALSADGDTISRKAAIEVIDSFNVFESRCDQIKLEQMISELQPASNSETPNSSDTISRQAAIDTLNEYFARIGKLKRRGLNKGEKAISLDTVGAIKSLPPAQPERIRGRWTRDNACSECGCQPWFSGDIHNYNFCPNCGADMREVTE